MGLFDKVFGKKTDGSPSTITDSIKRIREMEEIMSKKEEYLNKKFADELKLAKQCAAKSDKRGALAALKRKKKIEKQLQETDGILTNLEYQREALENAGTNKELVTVMSQATKALKISGGLDPDKVHDVMDDIVEQRELTDQFSELISAPLGIQAYDEDELLDELKELENEIPATSVSARESISLPSVPEINPTVIPSELDDEDAQLQDLLKWSTE